MKRSAALLPLTHRSVISGSAASAGVPPSSVRLFVVPVLRDGWVLGLPHHAAATPPAPPPDPTSTAGVAGRWRWLLQKEQLQQKGVELMQKAKEAYDNMPREGVRGHLRTAVDALQRRLDPTEAVLKALPAARARVHEQRRAAVVGDLQEGHHERSRAHGDQEAHVHIEVTYPAGLREDQVRASLPLLVSNRTKRHQSLVYGSTAMLPVSLAMGILPGPNVFFAWNVYRLYSHTQALKGGQLFLDLLRNDHIHYFPSLELEEIVRTEERNHEPLGKAQIEALIAKYSLRGLGDDVERLLHKHKRPRAPPSP